MEKISSSFFETQLGVLLGCNGSLAEKTKQFKESYPGREYQKGMTDLVLRRLSALSVEGVNIIASQTELEEFVLMNNRLLDILTEIGAGGVYDLLLRYSANISKLPGARIREDQLSEWARQLKRAAMEVMVMCRSRKMSADPPY